jgi:phage replication O-like protein O
MANPQKENGFTPIANEILEMLVKACLLGSEYQVVLFVIRKTYGWKKKHDIISLTQFELGTGLSRPTIVKTLKNVLIKKVVVKTPLPSGKYAFSFNKDYEKWVVKAPLLVKSKGVYSKDALTESGKHALTHKRKKETNTKEVASLIKKYKPDFLKEKVSAD